VIPTERREPAQPLVVDEGEPVILADLLSATPAGLKTAGEVPSAPSTPAERLALWCDRLPSPAPE
jgi:hypothetical protein